MDIPCAPILADITVERPGDQGRRAADQAGLALRVRSHHRPAGVADRRASGRKGRRARRVVFADAAVRHQAAGVRAPGRVDRRSRSTSRRSCGPKRVKIVAELQDRSASSRRRSSAPGRARSRTLISPVGHRWRQLAGRGARSRDQHLLHLLEHRRHRARPRAGRRPRSDMAYIGHGAESERGATGRRGRGGAARRTAAGRRRLARRRPAQGSAGGGEGGGG